MKIFVTRAIPEVGLEKLRTTGHEVIVTGTEVLPHDTLITRLRAENPDAVLCLLTDKIDQTVFAAAPNAKIFANYAVGFDNIDLEAAKQHDVVITNTPEVLTEAVAEHTVALIVSSARRIVEADRFLRDGKYEAWDPLLLLGMELKEKILGVVGGGRIGKRVAEIMRNGFGMNIVYHDRQKNDAFDNELGAKYLPELDDLLSQSDVVSIHLPLTADTRHLFNSDRLAKMKPGSLLINTARGAIVDEAALVEALRSGHIVGAALDVFENEPSVHPELLALNNVVLTPHIASATREARDQMSVVAANNIIAVLNGQPPQNPVV
ncbi:D-glycerate dehydrogenase [Candidatus Kaiserbacteria bacterium RIFCSPHIGHO2_01_FULL_46_22]|uniref:D-glycerate dehydrogenase n=1 Tax=Candidatus Kaiserbacteria bacterium RIFCSPHIGHO2_01_FULL_46_22 TaxID=1798475 RepID=A0A1F6BWT4_9BACT|nr:MAG: D-glycerate dehydrogenase [Candidatus Kaiserbacteria bacterium RIFCSPHIGHO2_01_FULL_46_22]